MSKKCELTGKIPLKGHNVSHANNKTKRRFLPNLKKVRFKSESLKKSILVIENDKEVLEALSARFSKQNMLVITAVDGYDGYTRACNEMPDIIVSETLLPSIDGFRLSRLLKFDDRFKKIPILGWIL